MPLFLGILLFVKRTFFLVMLSLRKRLETEDWQQPNTILCSLCAMYRGELYLTGRLVSLAQRNDGSDMVLNIASAYAPWELLHIRLVGLLGLRCKPSGWIADFHLSFKANRYKEDRCVDLPLMRQIRYILAIILGGCRWMRNLRRR